jgi:hypothetical protein
MDLSTVSSLGWPTWLSLGSLLAISLLVIRRPQKKPPVGKYSDSPIWAKPGFQWMSGLLVLIILGITLV